MKGRGGGGVGRGQKHIQSSSILQKKKKEKWRRKNCCGCVHFLSHDHKENLLCPLFYCDNKQSVGVARMAFVFVC